MRVPKTASNRRSGTHKRSEGEVDQDLAFTISDEELDVTPSTALRLAKAFGTSADYWLNGQLALDLYRAINDKKEIKEVEKIEPILP